MAMCVLRHERGWAWLSLCVLYHLLTAPLRFELA